MEADAAPAVLSMDFGQIEALAEQVHSNEGLKVAETQVAEQLHPLERVQLAM